MCSFINTLSYLPKWIVFLRQWLKHVFSNDLGFKLHTMPRTSSFPYLYDEALQINISDLKRWGYLVPDSFKGGTIKWQINGETTNSVTIFVNTISPQPVMTLHYTYGEELRHYNIELVTIPSNLGIGKIGYFVCPETRKKCRKLYSIGGYFLHREAFVGCFYECQTTSKIWRSTYQLLKEAVRKDEAYRTLHSKYFKPYYKGKPTKRYLKCLDELGNNPHYHS